VLKTPFKENKQTHIHTYIYNIERERPPQTAPHPGWLVSLLVGEVAAEGNAVSEGDVTGVAGVELSMSRSSWVS
jgi:hypothetical protein